MPHHGQTIKPLVQLGRAPDDCWEWLGAIDKDGNPRKQFHGETWLARRWLWSQLFGPIPDGLVISDTCQNPGCMNPHHLRACYLADAHRDGETAKLTPGDVVEIKAIPKDQRAMSRAGLARRLGCSPTLISDIWSGKAWGKRKGFHGRTGATLQHPDHPPKEIPCPK